MNISIDVTIFIKALIFLGWLELGRMVLIVTAVIFHAIRYYQFYKGIAMEIKQMIKDFIL